jgi:hypothetical protein
MIVTISLHVSFICHLFADPFCENMAIPGPPNPSPTWGALLLFTCGNYHIAMITCMHLTDLHLFNSDSSKNIYPLITFPHLTLRLRIYLHADGGAE